MNISINSKQIAVQGIRALRPGITVEQATKKTKKNGLDEVYFKSNGQYFVAYGDSLELGDLRKNEIPAVMFNGLQADIITYDDEVNSVLEGAARGALEELDVGISFIRKSIGSMITRVGPTAVGAAAVGAAGLGLYKLWQESQKIGAIGASLAASGATGGTLSMAASAGGASAILNGMKIAALSGLAGIGILAGYGAIKGALDAKASEKDYSSIASVTAEGASPTNEGEALSWQQLNANGGPNQYNNDMTTPVNTDPYMGNPGVSPIIPDEPVSNPIFQSPGSPFDIYAASSKAVGTLLNPAQLQAAASQR